MRWNLKKIPDVNKVAKLSKELGVEKNARQTSSAARH